MMQANHVKSDVARRVDKIVKAHPELFEALAKDNPSLIKKND
jgi:hypothetical protein